MASGFAPASTVLFLPSDTVPRYSAVPSASISRSSKYGVWGQNGRKNTLCIKYMWCSHWGEVWVGRQMSSPSARPVLSAWQSKIAILFKEIPLCSLNYTVECRKRKIIQWNHIRKVKLVAGFNKLVFWFKDPTKILVFSKMEVFLDFDKKEEFPACIFSYTSYRNILKVEKAQSATAKWENKLPAIYSECKLQNKILTH